MADVKVQLFDSCPPFLPPSNDTVSITVKQTLLDAYGKKDLLSTQTPNTVKFRVEGPRLQLTPADIAGVYPAPGSEESPDEFLPHIVLNRRTLPWERLGPAIDGLTLPWLALFLVKESELGSAQQGNLSPTATLEHIQVKDVKQRDNLTYKQFRDQLGLADDTNIHVLFLPNATLKKVQPKPDEIRRLCHMKRVSTGGKNTDYAIVISNRLPDADPQDGPEPEFHTALLVSMERREDAYNAIRFSQANINKSTAMIVLHHWRFTPSKGGDFEQVMQAIKFRPNGGVLRFGNLPEAAQTGSTGPLSDGFDALLDEDGYFRDPLPHTQAGKAVYRGPLRPFPAPPRAAGFAIRAAPEEFAGTDPDAPRDYSHAAAFELGRLMALHDSGILDDLHDVRVVPDRIKPPPAAINKIPAVLQKPDWVTNPAWIEQPWSMAGDSLIKQVTEIDQTFGQGDVTGIEVQMGGGIRGRVVDQLASLSQPTAAPVTQIDIETANADMLARQFADVRNAGLS